MCDSLSKIWVYGFNINGHHYGASDPADFHRGWPGAGFTHSMAFGALVATLVWLAGRNRAWGVPWAIGIVVGQWAHVLTDTNDTKGTLLLFPFTTHDFSVGTWAYGAQVGKHEDAAAYYSSLGFAMDVLWLIILVVYARKVLSREYFTDFIRPADPGAWGWLGRRLSDDALVAIYRGLFVFALARLISWTLWAHLIDGHSWDLSWGGPDWLPKVPPSHQSVGWYTVGILAVGAILIAYTRLVLRPNRLPGSRPVGAPASGAELAMKAARPPVIAHRACALDAAENSLAGIRLAGTLGAQGVEVDVRVTRDGVPVLVHDRTLWRYTRLPLPPSQLSYARMSRAYARCGNELASLADALEACPPDVRLALDVKTTPAMTAVLDVVLASPRRDPLIWSRDPAALAEARVRAPWAQLALLRNTRSPRSTLRYIRHASAAGADAISLHQRAVTPGTVAAAHAAGLIAYAWVVEEPAHPAVHAAQVDGIVSDWPRVAHGLTESAALPATD
jgi:glycerophosphoryl diester phosphodiesterase/membrane-bound metal-dependent hydrolase YbcI (DUF457 family)